LSLRVNCAKHLGIFPTPTQTNTGILRFALHRPVRGFAQNDRLALTAPCARSRNITRRSSTFTSIPSVGARHGVPLPSVKEYNEKVDYVHLNLVRRGTPWRAPTFVKIGAPPTRLVPPSGIEFQRVFGHERRGAKAAVRLDHRPSEDALRSTPPNLIDRLPNEKPRTAKPAVSATSLAPSCRSGQALRPFHVFTLNAPDDRNTSGNAAGLDG